MKSWPAATFFLLLAIPFDPCWQDYEVARRGILLLMVGGLAWLRPARVTRRALPFFCLLICFFLRTLDPAGCLRSLYFLGLFLIFLRGQTREPMDPLLAILPAGLLVALFALAQSLGLRWPPELEGPVSSLGNINVASEFLAVVAAAAALGCLQGSPGRQRALGMGTLAGAAAAIVVNTSLSGLLALPLACLPPLLKRKAGMAPRRLVLLPLGLGLLLGVGIRAGPLAQEVPGGLPQQSAPSSTTQVRLALWQGCLDMVLDRPLLGHGSGRFAREYPRYRRQEEIELSTHGRSYHASPDTAHNDYLECMVELGWPGLVLLLWAGIFLFWMTPFPAWGPLLAFAFLMGVRSPVGNAPACAFVAYYAGSLLRVGNGAAGRRSLVGWLIVLLLGAACLGAGLVQFLSQQSGAVYLRELQKQRRVETEAQAELREQSLSWALFWNPWDAKFLSLRARLYLSWSASRKEKLAAAREDVSRLKGVAPHDPLTMLLEVESLRAAGDQQAALAVLQRLLALDPGNLQGTLWAAEILVLTGEAPVAIDLLYGNAQPSLRRQLPRTLGDLAAATADEKDRALLRTEQAFLVALDSLIREPGSLAARQALKKYLQMQQLQAGSRKDMRPIVLAAVQALALKDPKLVTDLAEAARTRSLSPSHRRLLEPVIVGLLALPPWRRLLAPGRD